MNKIFTLSFMLLFYIATQAQSTFTFSGKPIYQLVIKRAGLYLGTVHVELYPTIAPKHVRNFDSLVSTHFYDSTAFHRVKPAFMIQGGDPNSRHGNPTTWGQGQSGQPTVDAEFGLLKHERGILSAARSNNINSATSQFFICVTSYPSLNGLYSAYGHVIAGMNIVDTIVNEPRNGLDRPLQKIEMFVTYIGSNDAVPAAPVLTSPTHKKIELDTIGVVQLKWNAVQGSLQYHLEVSTDSLFVNDTILSVNQLNMSYNLNHLKAKTRFYWRVSSNNGGNITYSLVNYFNTKEPSTVGIRSFLLSENEALIYPNPSNGKFTFSQLEIGATIEVLDLNGKVIYKTKTKDTQHTVDLEGKEKGIYLYKISTSKNNVQQGKMVIR